ncbi:AAA family ATPase [archaeon]|nr:AAA family ATPase [archaeon]MBT4241263.1 AAA family ATPase [archaeon]MBT4418085.1 AAA family ATPase [archaeon]
MADLDKIFDSVGERSLFKNKQILQSNHTPEDIPHRDKQIEHVASILAPSLLGEKTSNLFIYGKTGCIAGDSLVFTSNGWKKIKNVDNKNDLVLSFNIKSEKYEWSDFIFLEFMNKDKLLKIKLDNGFEIVVTKDHPLLLSSMVWKKSDELSIGDDLAIGYDLPNINKNEISLKMARLLGFIIGDGSLNKQEKRVKDSKGYWYNSNRQRCRFFNEEDELLNLVQKDLSELFQCTPQIISPNNRCRHVNVISQEVCMTLNKHQIPFGKKCNIVEIPEIVLESSNIIQREFLKALFSCDGTVSQNTYMVEYYSNSKKLLQQIAYLLYQEGIKCKIRYKSAVCNGKSFDSYMLYLSGQENLIKFFCKIGFYSFAKQEKLKKMLSKYVKKMKIHDKNYMTSKIIEINETYEELVYDLTIPKNHNFIANGIISHNTGKTVCVQHVANELIRRSKESKVLRIEYINCKLKKVADTEYRILAELIKKLGGSVPATGLPTDQVYLKFLEILEASEEKLFILILDEIDQAVKKISDEFLYNLTRINSELNDMQIIVVGISNDLRFLDMIDQRVRSSLSEEELVFPPYNAMQLQEILKKRSDEAFKGDIVSEGVIAKCAAFAAREHGDARRALDLMRVAGEIAERESSNKIQMKHIDNANDKIERDKILDIIETEPKQFQIVLFSIFELVKNNKDEGIYTGDIYSYYQELCKSINIDALTQRRVSDILAEFDMLGLINARVISKGRHGRTREIRLVVPENIMEKSRQILIDSLGL